ncbi:type II secretion system protein [Leptolyngbya sp. BC1307]|uniref:type II secretion system protein n=1 Tax=Leptolyngbya sp. BC1307 TaxID=2029589 RepID=UPI000EFB773F|nr:type II secretion system protein [Leptolyngbya sp. BC1307]
MIATQKGFTLLETLVVMIGVGIVAAIAAPSWLSFVEGNRLTVARDELFLGIRDAQTKAHYQKTNWQFSLRERDGSLEWASHPKSVSPFAARWETLESRTLQIDGETTFATSGSVYYVQFDMNGNVTRRIGRVTLSSRRIPRLKRCVIVSTMIGATRKSKEQATPRDGKMCY